MNHFIILCFIFSFLPNSAEAKNVILMIGDGMGQGVITATRAHYLKSTKPLHIDQLPYTAVVRTYSLKHSVTDSSSAASAMATGDLVLNNVINQGPTADPGKPWGKGKGKAGKDLTLITELAKQKGMKVGIVTSTHLTHATPASFYAKNNDRTDLEGIADDLLQSQSVDFILGGGKSKFSDQQIRQLEDKFEVHYKLSDLVNRKTTAQQKPIAGIFHDDHIPYILNDKNTTRLKDMSRWAMDEMTKSDQPFFMMIEGARIDHALHANDAPNALSETWEFDLAVGEVWKRIQSDPKLRDNTLLLVTADHDTCGIAVVGYPSLDYPLIKNGKVNQITYPPNPGLPYDVIRFTIGKSVQETAALPEGFHTANDVTLYAAGLGAEKVHGTIHNTQIFTIMKKAIGL